MRFRRDDFHSDNKGTDAPLSTLGKELTDAVSEEHPKHFIAVAEQQIMAMHHHSDGSRVELHQVGSQEFIQQSIRTSLEGKLGGSEGHNEKQFWQKENESPFAAAKIEYEKKGQHDLLGKPKSAAADWAQSQQRLGGQSKLYGAQHSVTGAASHETAMVGCNCGAEWTVTGQSLKADPNNPAAAVKVEQYGPGGAGQPGSYRASGAGGEKAEYRTGAGQQQDYRG